MKIKFAKDIVNDIKARGEISVPSGYVTGESFEKWLYAKDDISEDLSMESLADIDYMLSYNTFSEELGDAA